jgi:hypothetical protein
MTKKDFNAIAAALSSMPDCPSKDVAVIKIALHCAARNPNFDTSRFKEACKCKIYVGA